MKKWIINSIHLVILVIVSFYISQNINVQDIGLLKYEKLFELNLILLGVGISLITFLYSVITSISSLIKESKVDIKDESFFKIVKSINLNIRRLLLSLLLLIVLIFFKDVDIPLISLSIEKIMVLNWIKVSIFLYIIASVGDIILSTLRLYEIAFSLKDFG